MSASSLWRLNLVLLAGHAVGAVLGWFSLPDRVPIHFNLRGSPDGWAATSVFSWFFLVAVSAALSWFIHAVAMHGPIELWNLPERKRFLELKPERQAPILDLLRTFSAASAVCLTVALMALQVGIYLTARGVTPGLPWYVNLIMAGAIGALFVAMVPWARAVRRAVLDASASEP